jgi:hypothetical protein
MSIELSFDSNNKVDNNINENNKSNEKKWKELLYELFYEIKSEILGCKIEIEEEEYQENIKSITIPKLVTYIHDSIQILIHKKIEDSKREQKEEDEKYYLNNKNKNILLGKDEKLQYENIIKKLEAKERILTKINFQNKLQKDAMENKIGEYIEMEEEFEEMKTKLKYEDGRFLNNDRKDNEIIIIRGENSNLKKSIKKLEEQIKNLEKDKEQKKNIINKYENENKQLKIKLEKVQKQNEILNAHSINININNVTGANNKNNMMMHNNINHTMGKYNFNCNNDNNIYNKEEIISYKHLENKNKYFPYQKIKTKILNNKNNIGDIMSNTRNESSEKAKTDFLNKYFTGNKITKNNIHLNNSCVKINHFPLGNNNSYIPFFNRNMNYNIMKKIISSGGNNSSRSSSTKVKAKPNGDFNYMSMS